VSVLTAQVEGGEPAPVPQVIVAPAHFAQKFARPAETLPGGLVKGSVAVLKEIEKIYVFRTLKISKI
jgi:hypothetical protein